jgi:hypothetical protein
VTKIYQARTSEAVSAIRSYEAQNQTCDKGKNLKMEIHKSENKIKGLQTRKLSFNTAKTVQYKISSRTSALMIALVRMKKLKRT